MIFNNVNIQSKYKCMLLSFKIKPAEILTFNDWLDDSYNYIELKKTRYKYNNIEVKLFLTREPVKGKTLDELVDEIDTDISNISIECASGLIKKTSGKYEWQAFLESNNIEEINPLARILTLVFKASYKKSAEQVVNMTTKTLTINNNANMITPANLEITSTIDQIDCTLTGFTESPIVIKNLRANQVIYINEDGTIVAGSANKFNDVDLWEFPRLIPGANVININRDNITLKVKYKPRFI